MIEQALHDRLAIVEMALDGERMDVRRAGRGHHATLHVGNTAVRKQYDEIDIVATGEGIDGSATGVAGGRDHDRGALIALGENMIHQPRDELHGDVLERQRRAVKQLEHELVRRGLVERHHGGMAEGGIGLIGHAPEILVGNLAGHERPEHLDGDFPIGPTEQRRDGLG